MAINSQAREYVLGQMAQTPELRGALSQMAGSSANAARMVEEFQRLNPNNYNRYNPGLGKRTQVNDSGGWDYWNNPAVSNEVTSSESYKDLTKLGHIGGTKHGDANRNRMLASARLKDVGITDLDQVGYAAGPDGNAVFYDKLTGQEIPNLLKGWKRKGQTSFYFNIDSKGNVYLDEHFQKDKRRSGLGKIAPGFTNPIVSTALGIGAGFLAPGLGNMIGGALGGGAGAMTAGAALGGAGMGALHAGITGGDIGKSALLGGIGGGLGTYLKSADFIKGISNPVMRSAATGALSGLGTGGAGAALYGGDPLKGALSGALTGGASGAGGAYFGGNPNTLTGRLTGAAGSAIGRQIGGQLAGNLVGSPFDPRQPQQQQRQMAQQQIPDWLPQHAQQALRGLQGMA